MNFGKHRVKRNESSFFTTVFHTWCCIINLWDMYVVHSSFKFPSQQTSFSRAFFMTWNLSPFGYYNKMPQTECSIHCRNLFLTVLVAEKSKGPGASTVAFWRGSFPGFSAASSCCVLIWWKGQRSLRSLFYKALIPFMRVQLLGPTHHPRSHLLIPSPLGVRIST